MKKVPQAQKIGCNFNGFDISLSLVLSAVQVKSENLMNTPDCRKGGALRKGSFSGTFGGRRKPGGKQEWQ